MTIKELCKFKHCKQCVYYNACPYYYAHWERPLNTINKSDDEMLTKALLDTAKTLQEDNKLTNIEWIDFLSKQFNVSRNSAKKMLHVMILIKNEDNFNKRFCGSRRKES